MGIARGLLCVARRFAAAGTEANGGLMLVWGGSTVYSEGAWRTWRDSNSQPSDPKSDALSN